MTLSSSVPQEVQRLEDLEVQTLQNDDDDKVALNVAFFFLVLFHSEVYDTSES